MNAKIDGFILRKGQTSFTVKDAYSVELTNLGATDATVITSSSSQILLPAGGATVTIIAPPNSLFQESFSLTNFQGAEPVTVRIVYSYIPKSE